MIYFKDNKMKDNNFHTAEPFPKSDRKSRPLTHIYYMTAHFPGLVQALQ